MYLDTYNDRQKRVGPTIAVSIVVFFLSLSALSSVGWVPSYVDGIRPDPLADVAPMPKTENIVRLADLPMLGTSRDYTHAPTEAPVKPTRIVADAIGLDLPVLNPDEASVAALDTALLSGSVRYPLSSELNEDGNIFIFGHSSSIPIVKNQMFKAFNHISDLREGDLIKLLGDDDKAHIYRVKSVRRTDVGEALVDLSKTNGRRLTLSTCDTFGGKNSRFVVEADFVASYQSE
jgi:LPXTG-site transpeptidase (sortase) family protein